MNNFIRLACPALIQPFQRDHPLVAIVAFIPVIIRYVCPAFKRIALPSINAFASFVRALSSKRVNVGLETPIFRCFFLVKMFVIG